MLRRLPLIGFCLALALALWQAPRPEAVTFAQTPPSAPTTREPSLFREKIPEVGGRVGPASLARMPDGRLLLAWQENRTDDPADATIRLISQDKQGRWGKARDLANRPSLAGSSLAQVSQLGPPLIYAEGTWLHLWVIAYSFGNQHGAALYHLFSSDGGQHWSTPQKQGFSPPLQSGQYRLSAAYPLADGGLILPLQTHRSLWAERSLRFSATGHLIDKNRLAANQYVLPDGPASVQPPPGTQSILALSPERWLAAGQADGRSQQLQLWYSDDRGQHWKNGPIVDAADDGAAEFSAPFLLRATDGMIHLTYTWRQQAIQHLRFTESWVRGEGP